MIVAPKIRERATPEADIQSGIRALLAGSLRPQQKAAEKANRLPHNMVESFERCFVRGDTPVGLAAEEPDGVEESVLFITFGIFHNDSVDSVHNEVDSIHNEVDSIHNEVVYTSPMSRFSQISELIFSSISELSGLINR